MMQSLPSPRYLELRTHADVDDHAKENATSDQEGSLLGMEDEERAWSDITARDPGMALRRVSRRQRIWSALMSVRSLLDTVLLVIILGLLLERGWQKPAWFEVGGDVAGFAPRSKCCIQPDLIGANGLTSDSIATNQVICPRPHVYPRKRVRVLYRRRPSKVAEHCS